MTNNFRSHIVKKVAQIFHDLPDRFSLQEASIKAGLVKKTGNLSPVIATHLSFILEDAYGCIRVGQTTVIYRKRSADPIPAPFADHKKSSYPRENRSDQVTIESIRNACKIDKAGHWIWQGRVRYYGAPCMTYQRVTRPVRQVLYSILDDEHQIGMPLIPRCGNPLCVAPGCILPKRNADLMTEARKKKGEAPEQIQIPPGIWGQLMIAGRKS